MKYFVAILIALLSGVARAQDLRHFNPGIFGVSADKPVALLQPGTTGALDPTSILTDGFLPHVPQRPVAYWRTDAQSRW